jgi:hypothetical protein
MTELVPAVDGVVVARPARPVRDVSAAGWQAPDARTEAAGYWPASSHRTPVRRTAGPSSRGSSGVTPSASRSTTRAAPRRAVGWFRDPGRAARLVPGAPGRPSAPVS